MNQTRILMVLAGCLVGAGSGACEKKTPPPPAPTPAPGANSGKPLDNLAQNPTSMYGKSAAMGRKTVQAVEAQQAQAVGTAQEISGEAGVLKVGSVEFRPPTSWTKGEPGPMQAAAYQIPTDAGPVTCAFFTVGGDTGSNVNRWKTMMKDETGAPAEPKIRTQMVAGMKITIVSMSGTYTPAGMGGPGTPQPGTGFRGAIIEAPSGSVQVRMTGPDAAVEAASDSWMTVVLGVRRP